MIIEENSLFISYPLKIGNPKALDLYESNRQLTTDITFNNNKTYYVSIAKYLVEAKYGYHKSWGDDTGRNLAGTFSGTFKGIFPKITMQFKKLTQTDLEFLSPVLDSAYQSTIYRDPNKKAYITMNTYSNDWELSSKGLVTSTRKADGFSWAVISRSKRQ